MITLTSHSEALRKAEELTGEIVHYTNEGLEINLTYSNRDKSEQLVKKLKDTFSNVTVTGRKFKKININCVSSKKQGIRILEVEY